jgi:hypothetical protein
MRNEFVIEGFFQHTFNKLRCKWFGHKWEHKQISIGSFSSSVEILDEYYSCRCGETQSVEDYKDNERDSKINQILD